MRIISVLLAAHCGEAYIAQQIASILPQLAECDELLVSDDSPEDHIATREIVLSFSDPRVRYLQGPRQGSAINNVEFLLGQARGDIIVLCDQDDVWLPGKLAKTRELLDQPKPSLLHHNAFITDTHLNKTGRTSARPGLWRNLLKNSYTGCCMAFTKELLPYILPFPDGIPMHDQWIGLTAQRHGYVRFWDEPLILWRRHADTQTGHGSSLVRKIIWRWRMVRALMKNTGTKGGRA